MAKGRCALAACDAAQAWALGHFGNADLGDQRRSKDWFAWPR